ncbi:HutD/Ves family protein [Collimonas silvisoli]|uniref:HutD/Ves family protein n=1 Tax=Collimonas silvisoli TaxID=2825884 RepID=UPI001B8CC1F2|nr:HutD family protein [Collimonas silvisoli]
MRLISFDDLPATPWKNGGGVTRELHGYPAAASFDQFLWRVSIADVTQSGPFSSFPGVDRVITLLQGEGMRLVSASGDRTLLTPLQPHRFSGEEQISAQLEGIACLDFNLMLRRGLATGLVDIWHADQDLPQGCDLLFCLQGRWDVLTASSEHATLGPRQTLVCEQKQGALSLRSLQAGSIVISVNINLL